MATIAVEMVAVTREVTSAPPSPGAGAAAPWTRLTTKRMNGASR